MRCFVVVVSVFVVACTSAGPSAPNESAPAKPARVPAQAVPAATLDPSFAVVSKICAGTCGGPLANIQVFRDSEGSAQRLVFDGDLEACSHPPRIYFDGTGTPTLTIPMEPVVAGSPQDVKLEADRAAQTQGLIKAEALRCTDPKMCAPERTRGFVSDFACASDRDCMTCDCAPVDRATWERRGRNEVCTNPDEECTATNPVCCGGRCALSR